MSTIEEAVQKLKDTAQTPEPDETQVEETPELESQEVEETGLLETEDPSEQSEPSEQSDNVSEEVSSDDGAERIELEADQFAELLGLKPDQLDVDEDGQVRFKGKVDNQTVDVSLEQLLNAYQGDAKLTNRAKELSEMTKQREAALVNLQQQTQQFAQQSASLLEGLKEQYLKPFEDVNWKQLKEDDPGEYAAMMQDKRTVEESLSHIASKALQQIQDSQVRQNQELQQQYGEYLTGQVEIIRQKIPEFEKQQPEISAYMQNVGFSDDEISRVADARIVEALYKAMMFDKGIKSAKQKLSKPLPKVLKPGKSPTKQEVSLEQAQKLRARLKESGSMNDAVAILKATKRR